jgi:hypothetical protein
VDPASANPRPGATAIVSALVDADYAGEVTLQSPLLKSPLTQHVAAIRPALVALEGNLQKNELPAPVAARLGNTGKSPAELLADLRRFLDAPLPPQMIIFNVPTPEGPGGEYAVQATANSGGGVKAPVVVGNAAPPPLSVETDAKGNRVTVVTNRAGGPVRALRIRYNDTQRAEEKAFFAPFAKLGWRYDFGWLGAYLLLYIVALFTAKRLLRVP